MKKYLRMSSAAVVTGGLRVNKYVGMFELLIICTKYSFSTLCAFILRLLMPSKIGVATSSMLMLSKSVLHIFLQFSH